MRSPVIASTREFFAPRSASRSHPADFKRSHQDYVYCAGLSGVSAHAISSGGTREAAKGNHSLFCCFLLLNSFEVSMKSVRSCAHLAADALHGDVVYVRCSQSLQSFPLWTCLQQLYRLLLTFKQVAANAGIHAIDFRAGSVAWACDPKTHSPQVQVRQYALPKRSSFIFPDTSCRV
jgi:hypothetical protein